MTPREAGLVLTALRKVRGMTQIELSKRMGVEQSYLSRLESANLPLLVTTLASWCEALDADLKIEIMPRREK